MQRGRRKGVFRIIISKVDWRILAAAGVVIAAAVLAIVLLHPGAKPKQESTPILKAAAARGGINSGSDVQESGCMIGFVSEGKDGVADGFGSFAQSLVENKKLDSYLVYSDAGTKTQQVQDVRSMLNKGCKVIVTSGVNKLTFETISHLAQEAGTKVVSVNAPTDTGFDLNIKSVGYDMDVLMSAAANKTAAANIGIVSANEGDALDESSKAAVKKYYPKANVYGAYYENDGYDAQLDAMLNADPEVIVCATPRASKLLRRAASQDAMPKVMLTGASAGAVQQFHKETTDVKFSAFGLDVTGANGELVAQLMVDEESLGKAACYAAGMLANNSKVEYGEQITLAGKLITSDNFDEYLKKADKLDGDELLTSDADYTELKNMLESGY